MSAILERAGTMARLETVVASVVLAWCVGCGGDAGVELAAGDALIAVADQMQLAVQEYHRDVSRHDESREESTVAAFVARVQAEHDDPAAMRTNVQEFQAALRKIREDRDTEWQRRSAALSNVAVLREVAGGLQRLALDSLSLRDEARRYLEVWMENQRRARSESAAQQNRAGGTQP